MEPRQLFTRVVEAVDFREGLQPSLAALLAHNAVQAPRGQRIIKSFVRCADRFLVNKRHSCVVEAGEIAHPVVGRCWHDPGKTAIAQNVGEAAVVLKKKSRLRGERGAGRGPIHCVVQVNVEVGDNRLALQSHISRGRKISLLDILQIADQRLLRIATRTRVPLDCALVNHDRESEAGMRLGLCHHELRGCVFVVSWTIPVNDHAVDSATDHVGDLIVNLSGVRGAVAHIHVVRSSEPNHEMRVNLSGRARVEQRMDVYLADIACAGIAVGLSREAIRGAGVIRLLSG